MTTIQVVASGKVSTGEAVQTIPVVIDLKSMTQSTSKIDGSARFKYKLEKPLSIDEKQADGSVITKPKHFVTSKEEQKSKDAVVSEWLIEGNSFFTI